MNSLDAVRSALLARFPKPSLMTPAARCGRRAAGEGGYGVISNTEPNVLVPSP
jgi:hypothetical protein